MLKMVRMLKLTRGFFLWYRKFVVIRLYCLWTLLWASNRNKNSSGSITAISSCWSSRFLDMGMLERRATNIYPTTQVSSRTSFSVRSWHNSIFRTSKRRTRWSVLFRKSTQRPINYKLGFWMITTTKTIVPTKDQEIPAWTLKRL